MVFLSPRNDLVFKKLFGTPANRELLISFLNSILNRPEGLRIQSVEFNDPSNHLETMLQKFSIVNVRCTDENGNKYIIEMQNPDYHNFIERAQYYGACGISSQLLVAENYNKLLPVIFVGIVDYPLFHGSDDYLSSYGLLNKKNHRQDLILNEYYFIELPKFTKKETELVTSDDKWIFFLKNAENETEIPTVLKNTKPFPAAYHILTQSAWTQKELALYQKQIDAKRNEISVLEHSKLEIASNLLAEGVDDAIITQATGLSIDVVKKWKKGRIK